MIIIMADNLFFKDLNLTSKMCSYTNYLQREQSTKCLTSIFISLQTAPDIFVIVQRLPMRFRKGCVDVVKEI